MYVGGSFSEAGGSVAANSSAIWDDSARSWLPLPLPAVIPYEVSAMAGFDGSVACFASFDRDEVQSDVAWWDGVAWIPLGKLDSSRRAYKLVAMDGNLFVGMDSVVAFEDGRTSIAGQWSSDTDSWTALAGDFAGTSYPFVGDLVAYQGALHVVGLFAQIDGQAVNHVARWTGAGWAALGAGLGSFAYCAAVYNGNLIAAGEFTSAGGVPVTRAASWNGQTWSALPAALPSGVYTMAVFAGRVYAAGDFGAVPAAVLAWDGGATWSPVLSDVDSGVYSLVATSNALFGGGSFTTANGLEANGLVRYDGAQWTPVGSPPGVDYAVYTLATNNVVGLKSTNKTRTRKDV